MTHPSAPHRLAFVDGLRALSALWVIAFDVWRFQGSPDLWPLTPIFQSGHLGVEVFMVLSGFCLFYPIAHQEHLAPGHWRSFFWRRAKRILPPYYAAILYAIAMPVLAVSLLGRLGIQAPLPERPHTWDLISHLTFVHNLFPEVRSTINASFWSLSLEAQFYLVFPVLALALIRFRWLGVLAILAACLGYRGAASIGLTDGALSSLNTAYGAILGRLWIFSAGMIAAWLIRQWPAARVTPAWNLAADLTIVPLLVLGYWWYFHPWGTAPLSDLCVGLAIGGALVRYSIAPHGVATLLSARWLVAIGEMSYSFYLINRPTCYYVAYAVRHLVPGHDTVQLTLSLALGVPLSLATASLFYLAIERPFMRRGRLSLGRLRLRGSLSPAGS